MLQEHIAKLNEEIAQRDRIDQEIEACVCGLFERVRMLESTNEQLRARLTAAGLAAGDDEQLQAAQVLEVQQDSSA